MNILKNKIKNRIVIFCFFICVVTSFSQNVTQYVNPFIGTGGHGHTFPGATLPFGMVQLSPDTRVDGSWDGCSGYHYSDSVIYGFSHTHLSGTGCSDYGDVLLMPSYDVLNLNNKNYSSTFSHKNETASAGFYKVRLNNGVEVELTSTLRAGIHKYTFLKNKKPQVILDLLHRDETLNQDVHLLDSNTIAGFRVSKAWAREQYIYFTIQFSKSITRFDYALNKQLTKYLNLKTKEKPEGALLEFKDLNGEPLIVKVGISLADEAGALRNLKAEAPHWNFEKYKQDAEVAWQKELSKIEVSDRDENKLTIFYTALYHCFIHPSTASDIDGRYRGRDNKIYKANNYTHYSVFSLWDTYRALHPLLTLIDKKRTSDFINTFISQFEQSGRFPMWELASNETDCMIGFHSVSVIADALNKGITGFDVKKAYKGSKAAASYTRLGIPSFNNNNFLQVEDESESVSKSLEYGYDNWCIAEIAKHLNNINEANYYREKSKAYCNLFNPKTGFMQPRSNGGWLYPFYPNQINNHFTEGNSWQYSFYVPHEMEKLIALHGGNIPIEKKLDELFTTKQKTIGREQVDVTGLIGQYAHGNEPSHHMAYLYNYVNKPQKTIKLLHKICNEFYKNEADGLIGNEDCGQMSAWYVFSAMGFYPVCPGNNTYELGLPVFNKIKLNLENGKSFVIENQVSYGKNIKHVVINSQESTASKILHNQIANGGSIVFLEETTKNAISKYGQVSASEKLLLQPDDNSLVAPLILATQKVFTTKQKIEISTLNTSCSDCKIYYSTDGSEPTTNSKLYKTPFQIDTSCTIKAMVISGNQISQITHANFYKIPNNYNISITGTVNSQYKSFGPQSLIDGLKGPLDWRKGDWLGYQGQDVEVLMDLKQLKKVNTVSANFLQDASSWIMMPKSVECFVSKDNKTYSKVSIQTFKTQDKNEDVVTEEVNLETKMDLLIRYIKLKINHYGKLPEWHVGRGFDAFFFVDEIKIR